MELYCITSYTFGRLNMGLTYMFKCLVYKISGYVRSFSIVNLKKKMSSDIFHNLFTVTKCLLTPN